MLTISAITLQQAVRMAVAGTLAMACIKALDFPASIWAPLSALAVLQAQIGGSLVASRNYLIASATGVAIGALTVWLVGDNVVLAGAGIFCIVVLAATLKMQAGATATAAGVVPVLVLSVSGSPWEYGGYRLVDIIVGIASANVAGLLLWPSRAVVMLRRDVAEAVAMSGALLSQSLRDLAAGVCPPRRDMEARIAARLQAAEALLPAAQGEPLHTPARELLPFYLANAERVFEHASAASDAISSALSESTLRALTPHFTANADGIDRVTAPLVAAILAGSAGRPMPEVDSALTALVRAEEALIAVDLVPLASGESLLQLHSLRLGVRAFVEEVERQVQRIEHPELTATPAELARLASPTSAIRAASHRFW